MKIKARLASWGRGREARPLSLVFEFSKQKAGRVAIAFDSKTTLSTRGPLLQRKERTARLLVCWFNTRNRARRSCGGQKGGKEPRFPVSTIAREDSQLSVLTELFRSGRTAFSCLAAVLRENAIACWTAAFACLRWKRKGAPYFLDPKL